MMQTIWDKAKKEMLTAAKLLNISNEELDKKRVFNLLGNRPGTDNTQLVFFLEGYDLCESDPETEDGLEMWKDIFATPATQESDDDSMTWQAFDQIISLGSTAWVKENAMIEAGCVKEEFIPAKVESDD